MKKLARELKSFKRICILFFSLFFLISGCGSSGSPSDPDADTNHLNFSVILINEASGTETDAISEGNPGILQITVTFDSGKPAAGKLVTAIPTKGSFSVSADGTDSTDANGVAEIKLAAVNADGDSVTGAGEISVQSGDYEMELPFAFQIGVPDSTRLGVFIDGTFQVGLLSSSLLNGETLSYGGTALIVADLVDEDGSSFNQPATVQFSSQCGATITESVITENGQAVCVYTSNGCSASHDVVTATVLKGGTDLTAMVAIPLAQEATGSIEFVSVQPANIAVAGTATLTKPENSLVTFRVKDDKGNVMDRELVFFSLTTTTGGITVSPLSRETDENGEVTALVKSGTVTTSVRVKALAGGSSISTLSGNISIEETPLSESIGSISLSSGSVIIPADGQGQVTLRAKVLDKNGIPMPVVDVDFLTTLGTLSAATAWTRSDGIAEVQLRSTSSGTAVVTANAHGFLTNLQINFIPGNLMNISLQPAVTNDGTIETGESIYFNAILRDSRGNPVPNEQINFTFTDNGNNSGASVGASSGITNDSGIALVNYIAGTKPGVDWIEATLNSNNSISNTTRMEVIQKTAIVGSMLINAEPVEIKADGTSSSAITVKITDISGMPVPSGTEVRFSASMGLFANGGNTLTMETNDDSGTLTVSLISSLTAGDAKVTAISGGVSQSVTVTFSTTVEPIVGSISLTATPTAIIADGNSSCTINAVIYDTTGEPIPQGQQVVFTTTLGTFADGSSRYVLSTTDDSGIIVTSLKAGTVSGLAVVTASVGGVSQSVTVSFDSNETPDVGKLVIQSISDTLPADGSSSTAITVTVSDFENLPMPAGTPVTLSTTLGSFPGGIDPDGAGPISSRRIFSIIGSNGQVMTSLIAPLSQTGTAAITASSGGVSQSLNISIGDGANGSVEAAAIGLVASQTALNPDSVTTITAMVYDASGHGIGGQKVEFVLDDPTLGSITASGTTAVDGTFVADFVAGSATGVLNVRANSGTVTSSPLEITIKNQFVDSITVSANPTSITVTKTASVSALVADVLANPVPNATVTFSLQDSAFGTITSSAITNAVGIATVTFVAANYPGTATIVATSGSMSDTADLDIQPAEAASIEFASVSTNPIAVRGTGGQEFAVVTFNVKDVNGNPAEDVDVLFTMTSGMQGSEYLESNDVTPYEQVVATSSGIAEVTLHSGFEAGTVSIAASITTSGGATISATTPIISVGGGVVTDEWFVVSVGEPGWNMGGLGCVGVETSITAWLADRFGNYNVLDGHTVSFQSEVGLAVNPIGLTDGGTGAATTTIRTQGVPKDVVPEVWEVDLKAQMLLEFGGLTATGDPLPSGNPRDGVCNVLVFTVGEESFVDGSGGNEVNGVYDVGEVFFDTVDDPWRDYDDDGLWDDGTDTTLLTTVGQIDPSSGINVNPEEDEYQDRSGNDQWDGDNGVWDGNKNLFRQVDFLITGTPHIRIDKSTFTVANGGSDTVKILICDENYNRLSAGSTYTVSIDTGEITGGVTSYEYPSSSFYGSETSVDWNGSGAIDDADYMLAHRNLIVNEIVISDADAANDKATSGSLSITVIWKSNGGCGDVVETLTINGIVN